MTDSCINDFVENFTNGRSIHAQDFLGARFSNGNTVFRVWAPNAVSVSIAGDFNFWDTEANPMSYLSGGIWEASIDGLAEGDTYKYAIGTRDGQTLWKADPYGLFAELRPASASRLYELTDFEWEDDKWLSHRRTHKVYSNPLNIYEIHLASWKRKENGDFLTYREMSEELIPYVKGLGSTHIELMPLTEYPYDGSWGYQCTGYFAATSRFGTPHDLMYFINACHKAGLGVIMDWVPAHFPKDPQGLVEFDGSRLYEDSDPQMAEHPSWGTRIFDFSKGEVRSFLISSALFWLEKYHIDGLRVDAVASMLYLDYDRKPGQWKPNRNGGNENLHAVDFLRALNEACFSFDDSIMMIAEESTAWPLVTAPTEVGGLGFNLKWNMGWMNDTLSYLKTDPYFRAGCHNNLTFSIMYAFSENYVLPISHDEVVHLKGSIFSKTPGTSEQKFSNIRTFYAFMIAHPGKKLLFMGAELGQQSEWDFASQLPWQLLSNPDNSALHKYFIEINRFYKSNRPLWEKDFDELGFQWICPDEKEKNVIAFIRKDAGGRTTLFVCNFSGVLQKGFRLGVPGSGRYEILFSTDSIRFGGSGAMEARAIYEAEKIPYRDQKYSIILDIPPLSGIFLHRTRKSLPQIEDSNNLI